MTGTVGHPKRGRIASGCVAANRPAHSLIKATLADLPFLRPRSASNCAHRWKAGAASHTEVGPRSDPGPFFLQRSPRQSGLQFARLRTVDGIPNVFLRLYLAQFTCLLYFVGRYPQQRNCPNHQLLRHALRSLVCPPVSQHNFLRF